MSSRISRPRTSRSARVAKAGKPGPTKGIKEKDKAASPNRPHLIRLPETVLALRRAFNDTWSSAHSIIGGACYYPNADAARSDEHPDFKTVLQELAEAPRLFLNGVLAFAQREKSSGVENAFDESRIGQYLGETTELFGALDKSVRNMFSRPITPIFIAEQSQLMARIRRQLWEKPWTPEHSAQVDNVLVILSNGFLAHAWRLALPEFEREVILGRATAICSDALNRQCVEILASQGIGASAVAELTIARKFYLVCWHLKYQRNLAPKASRDAFVAAYTDCGYRLPPDKSGIERVKKGITRGTNLLKALQEN